MDGRINLKTWWKLSSLGESRGLKTPMLSNTAKQDLWQPAGIVSEPVNTDSGLVDSQSDIQQSGDVRNKFQVTEMMRDQFLDTTPLGNLMTKRTVTVDKDKIDYRKVHQFRITNDRPQQLEVKLSHDDDEQ